MATWETVGQLDCSILSEVGNEVRTVGTRTTGPAQPNRNRGLQTESSAPAPINAPAPRNVRREGHAARQSLFKTLSYGL
jgi:hypothetical protein